MLIYKVITPLVYKAHAVMLIGIIISAIFQDIL